MILAAHRIHRVDACPQIVYVFLGHLGAQHRVEIVLVQPHNIRPQGIILIEIDLRHRDAVSLGPIPGQTELNLLYLLRLRQFHYIVHSARLIGLAADGDAPVVHPLYQISVLAPAADFRIEIAGIP